MLANLKTYVIIFLLGACFGTSVMLYFKHQSSLEFESKYSKLVEKSQGLQKEIDRLKKEVNNVQVPDLKEDEVVDYWKEFLK